MRDRTGSGRTGTVERSGGGGFEGTVMTSGLGLLMGRTFLLVLVKGGSVWAVEGQKGFVG